MSTKYGCYMEYIALIVFMFDFLHCRPKYLVCILSSFSTYNCSMACFTLSVLFSIGADLNTTSICRQVSVLALSEVRQTDHDAGVLPLGEFVEHPQQVDTAGHVPPAVDRGVAHLTQWRSDNIECTGPDITSRVSAVSSGCSPMTQEGKSSSAMLFLLPM